MALRTFQVALGDLSNPPAYETGWYYNPDTGERYYYDASMGQWYISVAGYLYPMATQWVNASTINPSAPIGVTIGDTVRITVSFKYQGPSNSFTLYGAVGVGTYNSGTGSDSGPFKEGSPPGRRSFTVGPDTTPTTYSDKYVDVVVPSSADLTSLAGRQAAIYVKIIDGIGLELYKTLSVYLRGALAVAGVEVKFSDLAIIDWSRVE